VEAFKEKVLKAQSEGSVATLYVLAREAHELLSEDELVPFYANILELALENLTDVLGSARQMDINEVEDFATLRAIYEYAMEHYSVGKKRDASALFEVLSGLSSDKKFSEAMKIHQAGADAGMSIDAFVENVGDMDTTRNTASFYISEFKKEGLKTLQGSGS